MKLLPCFAFLAILYTSYADELSDCKCWTGYEAQKTDDGVKCKGVLLLHIMACNVPEKPKCKCSGKVTGILSDDTGIWCSEYDNGKEVKKWKCENKEEWEKFYKLYPKEKP